MHPPLPDQGSTRLPYSFNQVVAATAAAAVVLAGKVMIGWPSKGARLFPILSAKFGSAEALPIKREHKYMLEVKIPQAYIVCCGPRIATIISPIPDVRIKLETHNLALKSNIAVFLSFIYVY